MDSEPNSGKRLSELFRLNALRAKRFVRLKLGAKLRRRVNSDDILQEALLEASQAFRSRDDLSSMDAREFFPWFSRIIENKVRDQARFHLQAQRRSVQREERLEDRPGKSLGLPGRGKTPSALLIDTERFEEVQEALKKLSPREREVVTLVHLKAMKIAEAAKRLGKTPNATSVLLHQALEKLAVILGRRKP